MPISSFRFNKSNLQGLVAEGLPITVRDTEVSGLKFKVGKKRSVFQYEKRISGRRGAPITFSIGAFPAISVDEARQESRRLANLCEKGIDPRTEKQSEEQHVLLLSAMVAKFFSVKQELAKKTLRKYQEIVQYYFPASWMKRDIRHITPEMLVEQFHAVRENARERCWEFLKVFNNVWNTCAPFYRDQSRKRLLHNNPIPEAREMLKHITRDQPKRSVVPESLLGKFVVMVERLREGAISLTPESSTPVSLGTKRMCDIALLALFTAFRFTEARHLKWEYVNLEHGIIRLPGDARSEEGDFDGTKNHHDHWVPLSSYAWELLKKLHSERVCLSSYIFPAVHNSSKPITRKTEVFQRISELIGSHYSPHTSRRTFASVADEVGLGFLTVKRMLNHTFQGGVTGGYIVPGFNPAKERADFQKVCDYILDRRAEFLGVANNKDGGVNKAEALMKLRRVMVEVGLGVDEVVELLKGEDVGRVA